MRQFFDAVLLIAFGGPAGPEDVGPFLAHVTRERPVPAARLEAVARHYELIGGRSPLNELTFRQARALAAGLRQAGIEAPVFVGMRNWHPFLRRTLGQMAAAGHRRALGIILSPQQSEAGWGRYVQDVKEARAAVGAGAPAIVPAEPWGSHPLYVEAVADRIAAALDRIPAAVRPQAHLVFTAHSIPVAMAADSLYVGQVEETARRAAAARGHERWSIAYQSRSGNPADAWLEPDIAVHLKELAESGARDVIVVPISFVSDHVEVLYDLDIEARAAAEKLGLRFTRAGTVGNHPTFVRLLVEIVRRAAAQGSAAPGGGELR